MRLGYDGGAFFSPTASASSIARSIPTDPPTSRSIRTAGAGGLSSRAARIVHHEPDGAKTSGHLERRVDFPHIFIQTGNASSFSSNVENAWRGGGPASSLSRKAMTNRVGTLDLRGPVQQAFPCFPRTAKRLVWVSDRNAKQPGEFNVFLADWVPEEVTGGKRGDETRPSMPPLILVPRPSLRGSLSCHVACLVAALACVFWG